MISAWIIIPETRARAMFCVPGAPVAASIQRTISALATSRTRSLPSPGLIRFSNVALLAFAVPGFHREWQSERNLSANSSTVAKGFGASATSSGWLALIFSSNLIAARRASIKEIASASPRTRFLDLPSTRVWTIHLGADAVRNLFPRPITSSSHSTNSLTVCGVKSNMTSSCFPWGHI